MGEATKARGFMETLADSRAALPSIKGEAFNMEESMTAVSTARRLIPVA